MKALKDLAVRFKTLQIILLFAYSLTELLKAMISNNGTDEVGSMIFLHVVFYLMETSIEYAEHF
jgi:hypothetical protein